LAWLLSRRCRWSSRREGIVHGCRFARLASLQCPYEGSRLQYCGLCRPGLQAGRRSPVENDFRRDSRPAAFLSASKEGHFNLMAVSVSRKITDRCPDPAGSECDYLLHWKRNKFIWERIRYRPSTPSATSPSDTFDRSESLSARSSRVVNAMRSFDDRLQCLRFG
jgi:hypothetical protein